MAQADLLAEKFNKIIDGIIDKLAGSLHDGEVSVGRICEKLGTQPMPGSPGEDFQAKTGQGQRIQKLVTNSEQLLQSLLDIEQRIQELQLTQAKKIASAAGEGGYVRQIRPLMEDVPEVYDLELPPIETAAPGSPAATHSISPPPSLIALVDGNTPFSNRRRGFEEEEEEEGRVRSPMELLLPSVDEMRQRQMAAAPYVLPTDVGALQPEDYVSHDRDMAEPEYANVPFVLMGLKTTKPDKQPQADPKSQYDKPMSASNAAAFWNSKLPCTLSIGMDRAHYYVGEKIMLRTEIYNQSPKSIKALSWFLIKKTRSFEITRGKRKLHSEKEEIIHSNEEHPRGFPVKARYRYRELVYIKLPYNMDPTYTEPSAGYEITYFLRIHAGVPRHKGPKVTLGPLRIDQRLVH
ncbi:hypothetical protein QOT17_002472 [Balamuthia mandrillaris]